MKIKDIKTEFIGKKVRDFKTLVVLIDFEKVHIPFGPFKKFISLLGKGSIDFIYDENINALVCFYKTKAMEGRATFLVHDITPPFYDLEIQ